jgi:hypothetical protein
MFSFDNEKKSHVVQAKIRRILDLTVPNFADGLTDSRSDDRFNRTLPALLCAWEQDQPVPGSSMFVATRDISSEGVGVLLQQPFRAERVLLTFWLDEEVSPEPWYFLGRSQALRKIGGGFWTLGIQLTEFAGSNGRGPLAALAPLVKQLRASAVPV